MLEEPEAKTQQMKQNTSALRALKSLHICSRNFSQRHADTLMEDGKRKTTETRY